MDRKRIKVKKLPRKKAEEHDLELIFEPVFDEEQGEMVAIMFRVKCSDCGSDYIEQIYTNGTAEAEMFAYELGFRDFFDDEDCWDMDDCDYDCENCEYSV